MYKGADRNSKMYIQDMIESIQYIHEFLAGKSLEDFKNNRLIVDAVVRNFEIIGEAANNMDEVIQENNPHLPWRKMYGLRNLVTDEYFGVDYSILWEIANKNLPQNKTDLENLLQSLE
ncbi:MAG: hypothetical protein RIQ33_191 [Bacteroidota bacterium]|jgi:uncharacterized protein with HEPN domain